MGLINFSVLLRAETEMLPSSFCQQFTIRGKLFSLSLLNVSDRPSIFHHSYINPACLVNTNAVYLSP